MKNFLFVLCFLVPQLAFTQNADPIATAAESICDGSIVYDPSYFSIDYPMGDVPEGKGVCTDVVIRTYRLLGIDLQQLVHEDMLERFNEYPSNWGLTRTDTNIDHRRVPNLMCFFEKYGVVKTNESIQSEFMAGDIVAWDLGGGITHIGVVSNKMSINSGLPLVVHNIGAGQEISDCLFDFQIIGHYRYHPN